MMIAPDLVSDRRPGVALDRPFEEVAGDLGVVDRGLDAQVEHLREV